MCTDLQINAFDYHVRCNKKKLNPHLNLACRYVMETEIYYMKYFCVPTVRLIIVTGKPTHPL